MEKDMKGVIEMTSEKLRNEKEEERWLMMWNGWETKRVGEGEGERERERERRGG